MSDRSQKRREPLVCWNAAPKVAAAPPLNVGCMDEMKRRIPIMAGVAMIGVGLGYLGEFIQVLNETHHGSQYSSWSMSGSCSRHCLAFSFPPSCVLMTTD